MSEYIFGYEDRDYGDIAKLLADALRAELARRTTLALVDPGQRIRATVIGASQFTVQVSGKTIHLPRPGVLPVHNVPVVHVGLDLGGAIDGDAIAATIAAGLARLDLEADARVAIAFSWHGDPDYPRLAAAGRAIMAAVAPDGRRSRPLLLMIDGDIGKTMGRILADELGLIGDLVCHRRRRAPGARFRRCRRAHHAAGRRPRGDQIAIVFLNAAGLTATWTRDPLTLKLSSAGSTGRSSKHRLGVLDSPVKPGNDIDAIG